MAISERQDQINLWNEQHARRNTCGPEGTTLKDVPTPTAIYLGSLIPEHSIILEVGSGNGRDARSWAQCGHTTDCIDFSSVALQQLECLALEQGISPFIITHCHDVGDGSLPSTLRQGRVYNAFYARSALTIDDEALDILAENINRRVRPNGVILIEGRSPNDPKIKRSIIADNMANDKGHLRRVYTAENMTALAMKHGWKIKEISEHQEGGFESVIHMLRLVAFMKG